MGTINISDIATFVLDEDDSIKLETQTNGDRITIKTHLDKDTVAAIAYLANCKGEPIRIRIKKVTE